MANHIQTRSQRAVLKKWLDQNRPGFLFILPALLLYIIFFIYPFIQSILISLTDWNGVNPQKVFIGPA